MPQTQQASALEAPEVIAPVAVSTAVAVAVPGVVAAPAPTPTRAVAVPAAAPAITPAASAALPKIQSYALPLQDLAQVAEGSGLQWVNSDATKIAEAQAAIAAEVKPVPVARQRPARVVAEEAPLVLVETKRDLGNMTLPFEGTTH